MNPDQIRAAIEYLDACLRELTIDEAGNVRSLTPDEQTRFDEGLAERQRLAADLERHETLLRLAPTHGEPGDNPGRFNVNRGADPFDLRSVSVLDGRDQLRTRAVDAVEAVRHLPDAHKERVTELLERVDTPQGHLARHVLATGSEAYRTAWQKIVGGAGELMTDAERHAVIAARALSLTDANGGYAVPFTLDPTIINTKDMSTNPFRRISTIRTTVTDSWNGVSSAGMTVSWDGQAAEVSDDSPTLAQPSIPVHKAQGFALGSIEVTQDWASIEADLRAMFADSKDDAEAIAFTTGTGVNQPTGVVTALDDTSSEVDPATAETFALADVFALENALPAKYRLAFLDGDVQSSRASWLADRSTYNRVRQFDTQGGAALWETLGGGLPPRLLGHPAYEASAMRGFGDINAAATAENPILILGDFRYYVVVDRVGMTVEFIPHVFGANGRPTGQRGWYCFWRVGADSVNDAAFRMLDVDTAA